MNIDPFEVRKELENSSPFQRKEIAQNYVDLLVGNWGGKIFEVNKIKEDSVQVFLSCGEGNDHMVTVFEAKLSEYPELKVVKPKQEILIKRAKIKKVEGFYIYLYDCEIDFNQSKNNPQKDIKEEKQQPLNLPNININNSQVHLGKGHNILDNNQTKENFLSKFFWQFILVIIAGLIIAYIVFQLGWNK